MEKKYYDNTPIIEYPLIVAELKQQLKAKDELIGRAKIMLKGIYSTFEERDSESMPGALLALADIIADLQKSLKGE